MKQKHTFQRGVAAAVLAGVVLLSGVPALAAAPAAQSTVATQSLWEETPLSLEGEGAVAVQGNEEVPLAGDGAAVVQGNEEVPLDMPDTPFFNALRQLLQLLGWKH